MAPKSKQCLKQIHNKKAFICDMDGVLYHGNKLLDGAFDFIEWLKRENKSFLFLTNSSERSPRELQQKLQRLGVDVDAKHFYTSALATASFLHSQCPGGTVYVIGEAGLYNALYQAGFTMNDINPDYVVVGETRSYSFEKLEKAVHLVQKGAKLIGTNCDVADPSEQGPIPACGSLVAPIEMTTQVKAYFVGKPNPLMMRFAMSSLGAHREDTVIIGDRMDTDIIAGIESEIETVLVMTGITQESSLHRFAYRPRYILPCVGDIVPSNE
eukprot:gb/GECH01000217.1/.p1 GENE.gb/GECH01000217.1/~~gb/GECH01000217.1/.p1  ORF type:complete len:269 (+),score=63.82 gb/GECH01000217.1/:1-807(+)